LLFPNPQYLHKKSALQQPQLESHETKPLPTHSRSSFAPGAKAEDGKNASTHALTLASLPGDGPSWAN